MHLLNSLFLLKTSVLEVRNEMVKENKTVGKEKMVRERNNERKKWCKFMVF